MKYLIQCDTSTGKLHQELNKPNQDALYHIHNNHVFSAVLADGAGSHRYSEEGAQVAAVTISNYLFLNYKKLLNASDSYIQNEVISVVSFALTEKAKEKDLKNISNFGSTLLFLLSDGKQYLIGHLGDGVIMGSFNGRLTVISFPENGEYPNSTFLTTSFDAQKHLRIIRGELLDFDGFLLLTDGIFPNLFNKGYVLKNPNGLDSALSTAISSVHYDDASYLKITWRKNNE